MGWFGNGKEKKKQAFREEYSKLLSLVHEANSSNDLESLKTCKSNLELLLLNLKKENIEDLAGEVSKLLISINSKLSQSAGVDKVSQFKADQEFIIGSLLRIYSALIKIVPEYIKAKEKLETNGNITSSVNGIIKEISSTNDIDSEEKGRLIGIAQLYLELYNFWAQNAGYAINLSKKEELLKVPQLSILTRQIKSDIINKYTYFIQFKDKEINVFDEAKLAVLIEKVDNEDKKALDVYNSIQDLVFISSESEKLLIDTIIVLIIIDKEYNSIKGKRTI